MISPKIWLKDVQRFEEAGPSRYQKIRMDRNERTFPYSEGFIEKIRRRIDGELLMAYPEPSPLYEKMARFLKQPKENLLFHSGSDQSIKALFETYISPKDKILIHRPGYAMYLIYANIFGAKAIVQAFDADLQFDYGAYIDTIDKSFKMAVLENPNGFVGAAPSKKTLHEMITKCENENVLCVIDEAYFFFHDITAADLINLYENLIVVRSFSKAFGMAGVRGGYILSQKKNIANISKVKPVYELTGFSIMAIDEILNNMDVVYSFVSSTKESLKYMNEGLNRIGVETSPSVSNFLAARLGKFISVVEIREILNKEDILIRRPFEEAHLFEWIRLGTAPIRYEKRVLDVIENAITTQKNV
jgi:histidinol-phosphate aminotransferase